MPGSTDQVRDLIEDKMRLYGVSVEDASLEIRKLVADPTAVDHAVESIRDSARRRLILKVPGGVDALEYQYLVGEARRAHWYTGTRETDRHWPGLKRVLGESGFDEDAIESVDRASEAVVCRLSDPGIYGLSKKGLVVGFVQSGKTANYSSVIAKAADAGFRLFVVLAGVHNALRCQTQRRLVHDVVDPHPDPWFQLTSSDRDFGHVSDGAGLLSARELRNLIVIKKNASRLTRLRDWLQAIPAPIRQRCPALVIDDEADQATPNTKAALDEMSRINELMREIVALLPTATYVGYTATPFANVFMDPAADDELYPSDFIIDLERPKSYFGAEQLFGRDAVDDADDPVDGFDMIRTIQADEALVLKPPSGKEAREKWEAESPDSLRSAVIWFALAVAARRSRGQALQHSSMLVHVTHFQQIHFVLAEELRRLVSSLLAASQAELDAEFSSVWVRESERVPAERFGRARQDYPDLREFVRPVLDDIHIVVDNGASADRLDYTSGGAKTVIAVGGNTLSRGLTLEGLVVSYFMRTVSAYDTLLQMGRWFGFRRGYEELPRIWMTDELSARFRYLAMVEEEIRQDMRRYEREGVTPRQLGLRIRQHPSMAITAAAKMHHVRELKASYGGRRFQTFHFDHRNEAQLLANLNAGRDLIRSASADGSSPKKVERGRWVLRDVSKDRIIAFLSEYHIDASHVQLQRGMTIPYLQLRSDARAAKWNVAVVGSSKTSHNVGGRKIHLDPVDLGLPDLVPAVNRARLKGTDDPADIKALMSRRDRIVDIPDPRPGWSSLDDAQLQDLRVEHCDGRGLLLLYPISKDSVPMGVALKAGSREPMGAACDILGVAVVFPEATGADGATIVEEATYVGLPPEVLAESEDVPDEAEEELLTRDAEPDAEVSGADKLGQLA